MAANGNLVRGEDELEVLFVAATVEFRKNEMIVRQQQRTLWRCFNA
jgi:hypothetical protein